ncbi:TRAP transporter small permease [Citreicella sp. C3M06]|uniref:TRAP transporter small permease n=1 Tax=Roseobacteraceae TaxID=2854170 RepID=UPI001C0990CD|nr:MULTISPECIES: TRAP transporter small permease [Roseobacteraceae]MBU2960356.1 TRAP transporter small permease [Citreicella sp. C3M06]MDO6587991.1 TRAP transporter small permease [Salipiger sp. 1_MG-2023]
MKRLIDNFEGWVCALLFLGMTLLGFANVVVRYLTSYSFAATQELLLTGFLLITVFGASLAAREGQHLAVTYFAGLFGTRVESGFKIVAAAISTVLLALAAWYCLDLLRNQLASGVTTPGLGLPAWYYSAALPLAFVLIAIRTVQFAVADWRDTHAGRPAAPIEEPRSYADV